MHFAVQKDVLVKALKDVTSALATRVVQPILSNVLIQSADEATLRFHGTDLDLTIETKTPGVVYTQGAITLPGKKLLEIVSKLPNNELVSFQVNKETYETSVTCKRSKFSITGLPADDFPKTNEQRPKEGVLMPADVLKRSISQTAFAAAGFDASSILGGVYMVIEDGKFECTATDGSRLAHRFEKLNVAVAASAKVDVDAEKEGEAKSATALLDKPSALKAIIPAKACGEIVKVLDTQDANKEVRMGVINGQITFETETHFLSTRLISGDYPRYQELFPKDFNYLASFKREELMQAIDRVAVMSDDRTHLVKLHFEAENVQISANTPDVGKAQEEVSIEFQGEPLDVAVNVRYLTDVLQRLSLDEIKLEMTGALKPLIIKGAGDDSYKYLLMPVQAK
ncbi:MAG: DNA polymerase III subunit beta [Cyanobacteria bacterium SZAS LIN-3]|nr:DNA polymerase III subunit beta [Cyanobacteria bacterium SZAS LIN-3]MBS2007461.1 DNA polymerase III subunit beta [Cyanobacteria bacterium SZAS TMP-1]